MEKRQLLLLGSFVAFYYLIHIAYDMPNLVHGYPQFDLLPGQAKTWLLRIGDIGVNSLFAFIPYLALWRWYPEKKLLFLIPLIVAGLPLVFLLWYWVERMEIGRGVRLRTFFLDHLFTALMSVVFGIVFYFIRWSRYKELQQKDLEIQNRQSELSFLRSQINPHFLFNSLNNIYSLVYHGSEQALTAIAGLSDLLRYMLYDAAEKVPLRTEMDYIEKYIGLQQLRFEHPIEVSMRTEGDMQGTLIPPLLLIPFVENAFKHGVSATQPSHIDIVILQKNSVLDLTVRNSIINDNSVSLDTNSGIGLVNTRRRLDLLYPGKYKLEIDELNANNEYTIHLILDLS